MFALEIKIMQNYVPNYIQAQRHKTAGTSTGYHQSLYCPGFLTESSNGSGPMQANGEIVHPSMLERRAGWYKVPEGKVN